jgi:hypothetical protein
MHASDLVARDRGKSVTLWIFQRYLESRRRNLGRPSRNRDNPGRLGVTETISPTNAQIAESTFWQTNDG